jgi:hypothetical protein
MRANRLLGALQASSRERIELRRETVDVQLATVVCEAVGRLRHVYFPQGAVSSLLMVLENDSAIETANIGREGTLGHFALTLVQILKRQVIWRGERDLRCPSCSQLSVPDAFRAADLTLWRWTVP